MNYFEALKKEVEAVKDSEIEKTIEDFENKLECYGNNELYLTAVLALIKLSIPNVINKIELMLMNVGLDKKAVNEKIALLKERKKAVKNN